MWPIRMGPRLRCQVPVFPNADFSGSIKLLEDARDDKSTKLVHTKHLIKLPPVEKKRKKSPRKCAGSLQPTSPHSTTPRYLSIKDENEEGPFPLSPALSPRWQSMHSLESVNNPQLRKPLEYFDDPAEYEIHTPLEWLQICQSQTSPQACVYNNETDMFFPCWVRGYEPKTGSYSVEQTNGRFMKVRRLSLRFNAESQEAFYRRVAICRQKRENVELSDKFGQYIDVIN